MVHDGGMPLLTRDQIVRAFFASQGPVAAASTPDTFVAPPPPPAPVGAKGHDGEVAADATVTAHLQQIADAIAAAKKAQAADPGVSSDPDDAKVMAGIEQLESILKGVLADQDADTADQGKTAPPAKDEAKPAPTPAKGTPPAGMDDGPPPQGMSATGQSFADGLTPGNAQGVPGDADDSPPGPGDIEQNVICQNPDCGHMAFAHNDTTDGKNQGACQMANCTCPGMVPPADQVIGPDDTTGGPNNDGGDAGPQGADVGAGVSPSDRDMAAMADTPAPPAAVAPVAPGGLPPLDPMPQVAVGPQFTIPVGLIEGAPTGDGRQVQPGAITWRTPPLPLMWMPTSAHDPSGFSPNAPAVLAGRIDQVERDGANIVARGFFLATKEGLDAAETLQQMGRFGVSADIGAAEVQITADPSVGPLPADDLFDVPTLEVLVAGELMGFTGCPFAAFAGCYIVLGDGTDQPAGDLPKAPPEAQMAIRYLDAVDCEPCSDSSAVLVASASVSNIRDRRPEGAGPLYPPAAWFDDPQFAVGDGRMRETIDARTGLPSGKWACPITVTPEGRYFGHVAQWGVCHQGPAFLNKGQCVLAPRSRTGYAWFHGRGSVLTAEGDTLDVGRITADTGHASTSSGVSAAMAIAHYDNTGLCAASVRAGEDDFGIWVAGSVHPAVSAEQVYTLRLCAPSGDWRPVGRGDELVAVLHVNNPGFPVAKATLLPQTGKMTSLVAAGVPLFELPRQPLSDTDRLAMLERTLLPLAVDQLRSRMAALRG